MGALEPDAGSAGRQTGIMDAKHFQDAKAASCF
jgi:hypothetical protein